MKSATRNFIALISFTQSTVVRQKSVLFSSSESKYGEQLSEQVRMCQNIARALKSPVPSPSKAQRMFTKRKDRMEKWVVTTPSSIEEEASSSEVCQTSVGNYCLLIILQLLNL